MGLGKEEGYYYFLQSLLFLFRAEHQLSSWECQYKCVPTTPGFSRNLWDKGVLGLVTQSCPTLRPPWAHQAPLSMGILQARILEWVAMLSSRGPSQTLGLIPGLLHCRQILYRLSHPPKEIKDSLVSQFYNLNHEINTKTSKEKSERTHRLTPKA